MKLLKKIEMFSKINPYKLAISLENGIDYKDLWRLATNFAFFLKKKGLRKYVFFKVIIKILYATLQF